MEKYEEELEKTKNYNELVKKKSKNWDGIIK